MKLELLTATQAVDTVHGLIAAALTNGTADTDLHAAMRSYLAAVLDRDYTDLTAAVLVNEQMAGYALANDAYDKINYFGRPINITVIPEFADIADAVHLSLIDYLYEQARKSNKQLIFHVDLAQCPVLPASAVKLLQQGAANQSKYFGMIDLSEPEQRIKGDIRKSYRSLINWGRKNLEIKYVDHQHKDYDLHEDFRKFHHQVAGRATRPQKSWDEMYNMAASGSAELVLGYFEQKLVAGTFLYYSDHETLYGSGVYDREMFDKPLAHWPLYLSILRAKQRGCARFNLGEVFLAGDGTKKEKDIAFFKKGFTSRIELRQILTLPSLP